MKLKHINILTILLVSCFVFTACKKDNPKHKPKKCSTKGIISYLPVFCGTPPVVYHKGIKDMDDNYYGINKDMTGNFDSYKLGDTVRFTVANTGQKDPLGLAFGDLTCIEKIADAPLSTKGNMLLLKVDHETYEFEGGHEFAFHRTNPNTDTIPITMYYNPPGDFGSVNLFYSPTGEEIFGGTIVWMGLGKMSFPTQLQDPKSYRKTQFPLIMPKKDEFQPITHPREASQPMDYAKIWSGISQLEIVKQYRRNNARIGVYKYTPSVGAGNPKDWDYIVLLHYKGQ